MTIILKCLLLLCAGFVTDLRVYFFTSQQCPPCRQMSPAIDRLAQEGYPIQVVEVDSQVQLANQFNIRSTPTTVIVADGQIVGQQSGVIGYTPLKQRLDQLGAQASKSEQPATIEQAEAFQNTRNQTGGSGAISHESSSQSFNGSSNDPRKIAMGATVRLRVVDHDGTSFATGTVIHQHGDDALILTCGHVFRDSKGEGEIQVDLGFSTGTTRTVTGELIDYNAEAYDVALVTCKPGMNITPVKIASKNKQLRYRDSVFSIGCDSGDDPSIRQSTFKKATRYDGVLKLDVAGRPVNGRSGGGLFDEHGNLVGVCNAAAVQVDEGIYTSINSVYWQLEQVNLVHLFENRPGTIPEQPERRSVADASQVQPQNQLDHQADDGLDHMNPRISRNENAGQMINVGHDRTVGAVSSSGMDQEIIVVVRDKHDPSKSEMLTFTNPSPDLLNAIKVAHLDSQDSMGAGSSSEMAGLPRRIPDLPRQNLEDRENMRAQSPK